MGKFKLFFLSFFFFFLILGCGKDEFIVDSKSVAVIEDEGMLDTIPEYIIFKKKKGLRPVFRIPSLMISQKGTFLVSCENRSIVADKGEIDVLVARKDSINNTWDYQKVFANDSVRGRVMNPIFLQDKSNDRIYIFAARLANNNKFAAEHSTHEMDCVYKYSDDDGISWSEEISLKRKWDVKNYSGALPSAANGIQMSSESSYIPTMVVKDGQWHSGLLKKNNNDWCFSSATPNAGDNESTVYIDNDNRIVLDCRTFNGVRNKYFYDNDNDSFIKTHDNVIESIVNLKAEITKCVLSGKTVYLMSFANTKANKRENLSLFASKDGISWKLVCLLEKGSNRFLYSNVSCHNEHIFVVYETEECIKLKDISVFKNLIVKTLTI